MATDRPASAAASGGSYGKPVSGVLHHYPGHNPRGTPAKDASELRSHDHARGAPPCGEDVIGHAPGIRHDGERRVGARRGRER